jgi:hypothetical protein
LVIDDEKRTLGASRSFYKLSLKIFNLQFSILGYPENPWNDLPERDSTVKGVKTGRVC